MIYLHFENNMTIEEKQTMFLELVEPIRDKLYMYAMALERITKMLAIC